MQFSKPPTAELSQRYVGEIGINLRTLRTGTAKFRFCPSVRDEVTTPTTCPFVFMTGPPLDPGDIGAVICNSCEDLNWRTPLIIPSDMVPSSPSGFPRAKTFSPMRTCSPHGATRNEPEELKEPILGKGSLTVALLPNRFVKSFISDIQVITKPHAEKKSLKQKQQTGTRYFLLCTFTKVGESSQCLARYQV